MSGDQRQMRSTAIFYGVVLLAIVVLAVLVLSVLLPWVWAVAVVLVTLAALGGWLILKRLRERKP